MAETSKPAEPTPEQPRRETLPILSTQELFRGRREIWIEHEGVCYRLRITRRNKLILQK
jgi:hemin uptake protein HemP